MRRTGWMACVVAAIIVGGTRCDVAVAGAPVDGTPVRLEFRERAHVVLHAWVRAILEGSRAEPAKVEGFDELVEAGRALEAALGDARLWGMIDVRVVGMDGAPEVVASMEALPREARMRDGSTRSFRDQAIAYAKGLEHVTAAFERDGWGDLRAKLEGTAHDLEGMLAHSKPDAMGWIISKIGWTVPEGGIEVPVDLVWAAPEPGGVTFRVKGGAVCMVGLGGVEGPTRAEVVLHEAMHAVDVMTGGMGGTKSDPEPGQGPGGDALTRLRDAMTAAGIDPRSKLAHDAWHTLFFVTAGEAVRRCIDPASVDYGVERAYYERVGSISGVELREWGAYLRGEQSMDDAVAKIVEAVKGLEEHEEGPRRGPGS